MLIDYYNFTKLDSETINRYILDLTETINTSENYDGYQWSIIEVVNNLECGYFDIVLNELTKELYIFGVYIEDVSEYVAKVLTGMQ